MPTPSAYAVLSPAFRRKHGIAPNGKGPHRDEDYGLPVPPANHPGAKLLARAVLRRASGALAYFPTMAVVGQVRKANTILYGKPAPTRAEKLKGRAARHTLAAEQPHHQHESDAAARARIHEDLYGAPAPAGSWEAQSQLIRKAAQDSRLFGGPAIPYDQSNDGLDVVRPYDIQIAVSYPAQSSVVISNGKTGEMWVASYAITEDEVEFSSVQPAAIAIVAKAQEALARFREAGRPHVRHQVLHLEHAVREADVNEKTGEIRVMIIRAGPGNPADRHWYTEDCLKRAFEKKIFEGSQSYLDHDDDPLAGVRSVNDLGGWLSDVELGTYEDPVLGKVGALYAEFHPQVGKEITLSLLRTCAEYSARYPGESYIGLSINAFGIGAPAEIAGETYNQVDEITEAMSVDLVTRAGAKGQVISFQESLQRMKTTNRPGTAARTPFTDPDIGIDIRTPVERRAEAARALAEAKKRIREGALRGPGGVKLLEAVGVADAPKVAPAANAGVIPKLTDAQDKALDQLLGIVDGGPMDELLDTAMGGNDDASVEAGLANEGARGAAGAGESLTEALSDDVIDAMDADKLKAILKARNAARMNQPQGGTSESAAGSGTASAEVREANARAARAEAERDELRGKLTESTKVTIANRIMEQMKVPDRFRPLMRRTISERAVDEADMLERAREFARAYIGEVDGAGVVAQARESASGSSAQLFAPACT